VPEYDNLDLNTVELLERLKQHLDAAIPKKE
jgi:hypothetical protein